MTRLNRLNVWSLLLVSVLSSSAASSRETLKLGVLAQKSVTFPAAGPLTKYLKQQLAQYKTPEQLERRLYGQTTGNGARMDYFLGKALSDRYADFLGARVKNLNDILVTTSSSASSSMSAQNLMLGLMGPGFDSRRFYKLGKYSHPPFAGDVPDNKGVVSALPRGFYPFPVRAVSKVDDDLFMPYSQSMCKWFYSYNFSGQKLISKYLEQVNSVVAELPLLQEILRHQAPRPPQTGRFVSSIWDVNRLVNYLRSMRHLGENFGLSKQVSSVLSLSRDILLSDHYFNEQGKRIILTPILRHIKAQIDGALAERPGHAKLSVYVGDDLNVWSFLQLLGLSSTGCLEAIFDHQIVENCLMRPEFGHSVVLELYREGSRGDVLIGKTGVETNRRRRVQRAVAGQVGSAV